MKSNGNNTPCLLDLSFQGILTWCSRVHDGKHIYCYCSSIEHWECPQAIGNRVLLYDNEIKWKVRIQEASGANTGEMTENTVTRKSSKRRCGQNSGPCHCRVICCTSAWAGSPPQILFQSTIVASRHAAVLESHELMSDLETEKNCEVRPVLGD